MEASSNSRDELSSTSLQLSVEQWELLRRLRNSHLTKQQILRAYDELDRLDRELGNLFNSAPPSSSNIVPPPDPISPSTMITQQISPSSSSISNHNKRPHSQTVNGLTSRSSSITSNGYHSHLHHHTSSPNLSARSRNSANELSNQYESLNQTDLEEETRELQELLAYVFFRNQKGIVKFEINLLLVLFDLISFIIIEWILFFFCFRKGDVAIHNEISVFVYRYDLKQSQIARMACKNTSSSSSVIKKNFIQLSIKHMYRNSYVVICSIYPKMVEWPSVVGILDIRR